MFLFIFFKVGSIIIEGDKMIRDEIKSYIEQKIIPQYEQFDAAHKTPHALKVIKTIMELTRIVPDVDDEMCYVVAAFHDLGLAFGRETHHLESERIVRQDEFLKNYFSKDQIDIMAKAVRDHRASGSCPENIYGKLISDADRDYDFDNVITRCINYRRELDFFESFVEVQKHIKNKYRSDGYMKEFYYRVKPQEIQDKFDLFADDSAFALEEFARIYGPLIFDMELILYYDKSTDDVGDVLIERDAVRGVCLRDDKILLVHLENSGEYKFPGGGVNDGESMVDALHRELLEEAGLSKVKTIKPIGVALQKQNSKMADGIFYQKSRYYYVHDFEENSFDEQNLDDYEQDLGLKPKWIDLDEAIEHNKKIMLDENRNPWVDRDTWVLMLLKELS